MPLELPPPHVSAAARSRRRPIRALLGLGAATALLATACGADDGGTAGPATAAGGIEVVATTTMLGDVTGAVVDCAGGSVTTLMSPGVDPHDFAASSAQVAELVGADLVVANGLGLEGALQDTLEGAQADGATVFEVAPLLDPIAPDGDTEDEHSGDEHAEDEHAEDEPASGEHASDESADDHGHGDEDPHVWQDVARMATAAELIGAELGEISGDVDTFAACGQEVAGELRELDAEVRAVLDTVPEDRRVLVTDHEAFAYFADAYGFEIAGVVVPGGSTQAAASSQELADLVEVVAAEGVSAIFSNATLSSSLVDALSAEVGGDVEVVELYVDSLGPEGSGADTYSGMMRTNAERIAAALGG